MSAVEFHLSKRYGLAPAEARVLNLMVQSNDCSCLLEQVHSSLATRKVLIYRIRRKIACDNLGIENIYGVGYRLGNLLLQKDAKRRNEELAMEMYAAKEKLDYIGLVCRMGNDTIIKLAKAAGIYENCGRKKRSQCRHLEAAPS